MKEEVQVCEHERILWEVMKIRKLVAFNKMYYFFEGFNTIYPLLHIPSCSISHHNVMLLEMLFINGKISC